MTVMFVLTTTKLKNEITGETLVILRYSYKSLIYFILIQSSFNSVWSEIHKRNCSEKVQSELEIRNKLVRQNRSLLRVLFFIASLVLL